MYERSREDAGADRARWLAEVAGALDRARALLIDLGTGTQPSAEEIELYLRIEAARLEVQALRLSRTVRAPPEIPRKLSNPLWQRGELGGP